MCAASDQRRFRLGLPRARWLVLATLVFAILVVALRFGLPIYWRDSAVREIERLGGLVPRGPVGPEWLQEHVPDEWTRPFDEVCWVSLGGTPAGDTTLIYLQRLPSVRYLALDNTQVTDSGLRHLQRLPDLQQLSLVRARITDAGLAELGRLTT